MLGVAVDVTERRSAEKALKESEELLAQVIDATPAAIFVKDRDGNFVMVNSQVAEMYGVSADRMVGTNERDYAVYSSEQIDSFLETDHQVIHGRQPVIVTASPAYGPDGEDRWFYAEKVPLTVRGDPDCVLAVTVEVTDGCWRSGRCGRPRPAAASRAIGGDRPTGRWHRPRLQQLPDGDHAGRAGRLAQALPAARPGAHVRDHR